MTNKCNIVMETYGMMFLLPRNDIAYPRHLTSEPCEHCFGSYRCIYREFTVLQLAELEEKRRRKINAMYESDPLTQRTVDSRSKRYQVAFVGFTEASKKGGINKKCRTNTCLIQQASSESSMASCEFCD